MKPIIAKFAVVAFALPLTIGIIATRPLQAQSSPTAAAQTPTTDSAGKMSFDAVSVKVDNAGLPPAGPMQSIEVNGNYLSATNCPLLGLIGFAYNLTLNDSRALVPKLPQWVLSGRFDVQARATGDPTKDQMRLMMQFMLADRFKLAVHYEVQQARLYNLEVSKPGKLGPQLRPYGNEPPCPAGPSTGTVAGGFPVSCGGSPQFLNSIQPGLVRTGSRNVSMEQIASWLAVLGGLDRPVFDRTGLIGTFDFVLEWDRKPVTDPTADSTGSTFVEALQDQLGLKLDAQTGPVNTFVVDHIEQPSPN